MSIDARRLARAVVLSVWAGFFIWLRTTGEVTRYLGPRTYWVVTFGGVVLAAGALVHFLTIRTSHPGAPVGVREGLGMLLLTLPVLAVLMVPGADLGALAASRRNAASGIASVSSIIPEPDAEREVQFLDIHYANQSESYAAAMGIAEGLELELIGFVTHPSGLDDGTFALTRFYVSCCAADAIPYSVAVSTDTDYPDDTWLRVSGSLTQIGGRWVLSPETVERVKKPKDQYLY
ncbi:MAG TPA: TIGR03943 family protein [Actinomycetota bacterium]|nr:TIGR03943 family protein [Actinomycetota bacterium]